MIVKIGQMSKQQNLRLILKYLKSNGYVQSFLSLQRESDINFETYSKEISFFRNVLLEGDFTAAVKCLLPLQQRLSSEDYKAILFRIYRQKLFELLQNPDEIELRELLEKDIVDICTPEEYQELFNFLTLERITDHPDFPHWTKISGRLDCFEFIRPYVEFIESKIHQNHNSQVNLQTIVAFYNQNANKLKQSIAIQNSQPVKFMESKSTSAVVLEQPKDNKVFEDAGTSMLSVKSHVSDKYKNSSYIPVEEIEANASVQVEDKHIEQSNLDVSLSVRASQVPVRTKPINVPENKSNAIQNSSLQAQQQKSQVYEKSQFTLPSQVSVKQNVPIPKFLQLGELEQQNDLKNLSAQSKASKNSKKPAPAPIAIDESSSVSWGKQLPEESPQRELMEQSQQSQKSQQSQRSQKSQQSQSQSRSVENKSQQGIGLSIKKSEYKESQQINMSLTPSLPEDANFSKSKGTMKLSGSGKPIDPILQLQISKSIKLEGQALEECKSFVENPNNPYTIKQDNVDMPAKPKFTRSGQDFNKELSGYDASISSSKSVVVKQSGANLDVEPQDLQPPEHFDFSRKQNPFLKMMRSNKHTIPKLLASVSDEKAIRVCQFSESGNLMALGTNSSKLKIFDVEELYRTKLPKHDLQPIYEINNFHQKSVFSLDWSVNEKFIASCSNDATVKLTKFNNNLTSHQSNVIGRHQASIRMVRFDAMLTKIISCAQDHLIKIWDIQKPKANQVLKGHYSSVNAIRLAQSESSGLIYSVSKDCSIRLWDLRTGQPEAISKPHQSQMTYISRYTENLLVGHKDGGISFYTPTLQHIQTIQIHKDETRSVESCPEERFYVTASFDGQICLMQRDSKDQLIKTYQRHNLIKQDDKVVFAAFNQSRGFASCSTFGVCNMYSLN